MGHSEVLSEPDNKVSSEGFCKTNRGTSEGGRELESSSYTGSVSLFSYYRLSSFTRPLCLFTTSPPFLPVIFYLSVVSASVFFPGLCYVLYVFSKVTKILHNTIL